MLEAAQSQLGRDLLQVYSPGFARPFGQMPERHAAPKRPYVKLHGDLGSHAVTALLKSELESWRYDPDTIDLVRSILATHDLIIAGYGGFDAVLADIIADAVEDAETRIHWCIPHPPDAGSPLHRRLGTRARHVAVGFDDLVAEIARPVLERPSQIATEPTFVPLLFKWRTEYCNREYARLNGRRANQDISRTFARRRNAEQALTRFLLPNKPLAIVTGPSGYGKTTLGLRLLTAWESRTATRLLLLRARSFHEGADLEQHVGEQLGGLGLRTPFSFHGFERWLTRTNQQLVIYLDGVNEFSDEVRRCAALLRGILRFCYFLPESDSAIRVVATVRQETWNAMLPHLDLGRLHSVAWSPSGSEGFETLACDAFDEDELREAVRRLGSRALRVEDLDALPTASLERLKDPFLFRTVSEGMAGYTSAVPTASQVAATLDAKLRGTPSVVSSTTLQQALAAVAMTALHGGRQAFREVDLHPAQLRGEILRIARDLDVVRDADQGFLQFDHDRTFEYFLAVAIADGIGPRLEDVPDLEAFLAERHADGRAVAAARLHLQLHPKVGLRLAAEGLRSAGRAGVPETGPTGRLYEFSREVLVQLAESGTSGVGTYLSDAVEAGARGTIGERHLRAVVQAAAALPTAAAINLLSRVRRPGSNAPGVEAQILAIDRLTELVLTSAGGVIRLVKQSPYADFFADASISRWQRIGRVASLAMQVGPDNTHLDEYRSASESILEAWRSLSTSTTIDDPEEFADAFLADCDRLLFNASEDGVRRFFANQRRHELRRVLDGVRAGEALTLADFDRLAPYTQSIEFDVEYHLVAALIVLWSLSDPTGALDLVETAFRRLDGDANPVQVDFLEQVVVYLHVLHGMEYDEARFAPWEEGILRDWPAVLLHRPGLQRGERRGFADLFDRIFEDGFGVVYPYGILKPSHRRRRLRRADYLKAASSPDDEPLPMYTRWLETYLREGRLEEAIQMLQALSGVIIPWPLEGLSALRPAIGHPDPRIRRAVVRVLTEAFNRHPGETSRFLRANGVAVSDDELLEMKVRSDPRLGRRQVSEEEYARLAHLVLRLDGAREVVFDCVSDLLSADSFEGAVRAVFGRLGWFA